MTDRPVECSQCKKAIQVCYKEIVDTQITCTQMCAECPILKQKLHGEEPHQSQVSETKSGLCCGNCRTTLDEIKMGNPLGCSECYSIFNEVIISELIINNRLAPRTNKRQPLHLGKAPKVMSTIPSSSRLVTLNEALNEALKKENYEQAAWIRDQIKDLT